jgi:hypothetical protein
MLLDPERIWMVVQGGKVVAGDPLAAALTSA